MDVRESTDTNEIVATFDLPGLKKSDVTIEVDGNRLTVSGEVGSPAQVNEKDTFSIHERRTGKFSRSLQLPKGTKVRDLELYL